MPVGVPQLLQTVLDARNPQALAEFYRALLGLDYRDGDAPRAERPDPEWVVLVHDGRRVLAFQRDPAHVAPTWPAPGIPQQSHLDLGVDDAEQLELQRERALMLGARLLADRHDDPEEPLYVLADPAGHPFCLFVSAARGPLDRR